ncbi:EFR1 family ferrodoxin [Desulfosporosinus sp.]|uniref:EFR1 family ferrodoxin n=1 Tax=Desulfosporosinus sp. TaxID=157907 RepID=UPI0025C0AF6F|nr:EFR1 family ferrodoxin [Desulfosporosinus sp.]MBC2723843.1 4Fe-4S binding protein [Desulfosporosinus sp.]MBC2726719.1 4Fe-4S binding protein [Desulfosporosinus sp.]
MEIKSMKLVCFSPTGTTKSVIQGIAQGINRGTVELIDITKPDARKQRLQTSENELLVVAVPVYMGRVPALVTEWLYGVKAQNTPAVCIVVYGNRAYENALFELKNILVKCRCKPIAGAAYIGEHSFSSSETPTAEGRPDASDLNHAELFGHKINEKLLSVSSVDHISTINIPGNYPYGGITELWSVDFIEVSDTCTHCGICAEVCPLGAIDSENSNQIDTEKCITCCACIKNCPQNARTMKTGPVKEAAMRLNNLYRERKEPVFFL